MTRFLSVLLSFPLFLATAGVVHAQEAFLLRLVDRLDRPEDGYCLEILGTGRDLRLEVPLFAHNCKPALTTDGAVIHDPDSGYLRFAALDLCVTAAGVNATILPGAALILRPCDHNAPYFDSGPLQRFDHQEDGRMTLRDSGLCLAVGEASSATYSPRDRWRTLFLADCEGAPPARSRWEFATP